MDAGSSLQVIWFLLIGILFAGYSLLDGFDLGVAVLLPILGKREEEKNLLVNSIGPFWDGNEVWLLTGGGALFAAFPLAYATVFSGFYLALMLVLFALIFRAVSLEFRAHDIKRKKIWEAAFIGGSALPSLLYGVALGNVVQGVPLNENLDYAGNFFTLLRPFPLVTGLLGLTAILVQGASYTTMKQEDGLQERARRILGRLWFGFAALFVLSFIAALIYVPGAGRKTVAWAAAVVVAIGLAVLKIALARHRDKLAFFMSSTAFLGLWGIAAAALFPNLVRASNNPALSLTISNSSSSPLTLKVMLIIAAIGMPLVVASTVFLYKTFRGKAKIGNGGYA